MSETKLKARIARLEAERIVVEMGIVSKENAAQLAEKILPNLKCELVDGEVKTILIDPQSGKELWINAGQLLGLLEKEYPSLFEKKPAPVVPAPAIENPFVTGNITAQGTILKNNPTLAQRLKADAEGKSSDANPFVTGNITKQSEVLRDDPALAERLRREAAGPGQDNPWVTGNLTRQVLLVRSDPDKARRLKAEAAAANGPAVKKNYIFTPPPGSFKRRVIVER